MVIVLKESVKKFFLELSQVISFSTGKNIELFFNRKLLKKTEYVFSYKVGNYKGNPRYCIFRYQLPNVNLFATAIEYITNYHFAIEKGVIPLIDLEYEQVFKDFDLGRCNVWDMVFDQPVSIKSAVQSNSVFVDEIGGGKSGNLKINKKINHFKNRYNKRIYVTSENWREYYSTIRSYTGDCWKVNDRVRNWCKKYQSENFNDSDLILGVMLREDFSKNFNTKLAGPDKELYGRHPLNPNIEEIVEIVKKKMKEWGCTKIFLSTMYYESVELFKKEFGNVVFTVSRERRSYDITKDKKRRTADMTPEQNYQLFLENREFFLQEILTYAYEVILLSECDYYIAPHCSGSASALAINGGKYKDIEVLENRRQVEGY